MIIKEKFVNLGGMAQEGLEEEKRGNRIDAVLYFKFSKNKIINKTHLS